MIAEHRPDFKQLVFTAIDALKGRGNELARFDTSPNDYYEYMWDLSPDGTQIAIVQYSGALIAGDYTVRISAKGFSTVMSRIAVLIGNTASGDVRLPLGIGAEVIDVTSSGLKVNTQQAMVQGVLNSLQVESLPVNGRNFLDLAQLEPGVQIQDGQNFDLTKAGIPRSRSVGAMAAPPGLKWMGWTLATKPWALPQLTSPPAPFRGSSLANPV